MLPKNFEIPVREGVTLLDHQKENVFFAASKKVSLIADPPGLGKTLSAIALLNCYKVQRVLIICPASLKLNWKRELEKYGTHGHLEIGVSNSRASNIKPITIINYDLIQKYHAALVDEPWDYVILDEAHYIKNPQAKRTMLILGKKAKRKPIQAIPFKRMILLTGTPMTNRPVDLWNFCQIADPDGLGKDYFSFVKRYCAAFSGPWGLDVSGASNLEELGNKMRAAFMIRHDKGLLNLPPKFRTVIELPTDGLGVQELLKKEITLYEEIKNEAVVQVPDNFAEQVAGLKKVMRPAKIQSLADLTATRQEIAMKKLPMALSFVDSLVEQGEKVVLFSFHTQLVEAIADHYGDRAVTVSGRVSQKQRQANVDAFQADPSVKIFNGQIMAAGVGITLTASCTTVFVELDYVPANLEQAEDRVHRISQDRIVNAYYMVLEGSNDARISHALVKKKADIAKVMVV